MTKLMLLASLLILAACNLPFIPLI